MSVYSGKLDAGSYVFNTRSDKKERISRLYPNEIQQADAY
jgi:elongation factor G